MMRMLSAAAGMMLAACVPALADDEPRPLQGTYMAAPADDEAGIPPTLYVTLTGEAAKAVYEGLATPGEEDQCQGGRTKWLAEGGFCNFAAEQNEYFCSFGIDLKNSKFAFNQDC